MKRNLDAQSKQANYILTPKYKSQMKSCTIYAHPHAQEDTILFNQLLCAWTKHCPQCKKKESIKEGGEPRSSKKEVNEGRRLRLGDVPIT